MAFAISSSTAPTSLVPPFTRQTAEMKVRAAEDAWNSRDPARVKMAYSPDSRWRNRDTFLQGRDAIEQFLTAKWQREQDYRLVKQLWTFQGRRIAVRFVYEFHDDAGQWHRAHGNENWQFDDAGLMEHRWASINDHAIDESDRWLRWPMGRRPDGYPELDQLGLYDTSCKNNSLADRTTT